MKIQVNKSVEGGEAKQVIIEEELYKALTEFDFNCQCFSYLITRNIVDRDDTVWTKMKNISDACEATFRKFKLDKYDVRAHYDWNNSVRLNNDGSIFKTKEDIAIEVSIKTKTSILEIQTNYSKEIDEVFEAQFNR